MKSRDIEQALEVLNQGLTTKWQLGEKHIEKVFIFADFQQAMAFMAQVGQHAEALNHHPDWSNSYNRVSIKLSTHSVSRITALDFALAGHIEQEVATIGQTDSSATS